MKYTTTWAANSQINSISTYKNAMLVDPIAQRHMIVAITPNDTTARSNLGGLTMCHGTAVNNNDNPIGNNKQQKIADAWKHKDFTPNAFDRNTFDKNDSDKIDFDKNSYDSNNSGSNNSDRNRFDRNDSDKSNFDQIGTTRKIQGTGTRVVKVDAASHVEELHITLDHSSWLSHES